MYTCVPVFDSIGERIFDTTRYNSIRGNETDLDRAHISQRREHGKENRSRLVTARSALVIANERLADIGAEESDGNEVTSKHAGDVSLSLSRIAG